jgi:hypothetical protein
LVINTTSSNIIIIMVTPAIPNGDQKPTFSCHPRALLLLL